MISVTLQIYRMQYCYCPFKPLAHAQPIRPQTSSLRQPVNRSALIFDVKLLRVMDVLHVASNYILTHHTISSKPIYLYDAGINKGLEENNSVSVQYVIKQKKNENSSTSMQSHLWHIN